MLKWQIILIRDNKPDVLCVLLPADHGEHSVPAQHWNHQVDLLSLLINLSLNEINVAQYTPVQVVLDSSSLLPQSFVPSHSHLLGMQRLLLHLNWSVGQVWLAANVQTPKKPVSDLAYSSYINQCISTIKACLFLLVICSSVLRQYIYSLFHRFLAFENSTLWKKDTALILHAILPNNNDHI